MALWGLALWREAGLPESVLQVVTGDGPGTGSALVDRADFVSFTGSSATGRLVAERAARRLVGCSLELGGKNPMIVRADADLDAAVAGAVRGCFTNAGQLCVSIERLYVHAALFERFVAALGERARGLRAGGRLRLRGRRGLPRLAGAARPRDGPRRGRAGEGSDRGHGRPRPPGRRAALLRAHGPHRRDAGNSGLHAEETFGPVVAVYPFSSDDEAIALANDSCYGLNASVWTRDVDAGLRMAGRIEAGTVNVNDAYTAAWASLGAPQGGVKESGLGRRHGADGLLKYTVSQTISAQRGPPLDFMTGRLAGSRLQRLMPRLLKVLSRVPGLG